MNRIFTVVTGLVIGLYLLAPPPVHNGDTPEATADTE